MPVVCVINPNTDDSMTESILTSARAAAAPDTEVVGGCPSMGPASIESHYDEALAVPGLLEQIGEWSSSERGRPVPDGFLVACFGDPGLDAARELSSVPVVGLAEAAFHMASLLGRRFSVVTTLERTVGRAEDLLRTYGFAERCVRVRACEVAVLALEDPASSAVQKLIEEGQRAMAEDGVDALVLGCAGMTHMLEEVRAALPVPVVDGVAAGINLVADLARMGLLPAHRGEFAPPLPKQYRGLLESFTPASL